MLAPNQMVRMFHLCADILAIQRELPAAPPGVDDEVIAAHLQPYVQAHSALLVELRELLRSVQ
jgi:hypothetical protein